MKLTLNRSGHLHINISHLSPAMHATTWLALLLLAVATGQCNAEENKDIVFTQTDRQLDATFFDNKAGFSISVSSSESNFRIVSSSGKVLVNLMEPLYEDGKGLDQLVVIHGRPFLDHRRRNKASSYSITDKEAEELMAAAELEQETTDQELLMSQEVTVASIINGVIKRAARESKFHKQAIRSAITDLINDPHTPVIINAAITMGEKEGITGHEYPPALPFYAFARVLSKIYDDQWLLYNDASRLFGINPKKDCDKNLKCYRKCPPCKEKKCLGLCGRKCTCWRWVCGDCCWHRGCCIHDVCCKKYGYFSLACLNVWKFRCHKYSC